jgi:hypothetical protein
MKRQVFFLILILYVGALGARDTVLKLYRPFGDSTSKEALVVVRSLLGECSQQSKLTLREDAWRCVAEGQFFDPCFAPLGANQTRVLCPSSAWSREAVQIEVNSPLDNQEHQRLDMSRAFPWAIELADGERCHAIEANQTFDSMPIRYRCSNQNSLMGTIQRCDPQWSMLEKTPHGVVTKPLTFVWF